MKVTSPINRKMFGEWLRQKRKDAGLSLRQAASEIGFSTGRLKQIECGYDPVPLLRLFDILEVYRIDLDDMLKRLETYEPDLYKKYLFLERKFLELFISRFQHKREALPQYIG